MITKVSYVRDGEFKIDNGDTLLAEQSLKALLKEQAGMSELDAEQWVEEAKMAGEKDLDLLSVLGMDRKSSLNANAATGVVVDLYEVDYPEPADKYKETQTLMKHLDEYEDFVTQYLFPSTETEDVIVMLHPEAEGRERPVSDIVDEDDIVSASSGNKNQVKFSSDETRGTTVVDILNNYLDSLGSDFIYTHVLPIRHEHARKFSNLRVQYPMYVIAMRGNRQRKMYDLVGIKEGHITILSEDIDLKKVEGYGGL